MATAMRNPADDARLFRWGLTMAVLLHLTLGALLVISEFYAPPKENWGSAGNGSIKVGMVGSVPQIPLPQPEIETPSRVVDESKGLYKEEPPKITQPPPDAIPIPKVPHLKPPKPTKEENVTPSRPKPEHPSKILENKIPPPPNAVPYGHGGAPTVPATSFTMGAGNTSAGISFNGPSGNGDFGSKYPWYVEAVQRRISSNWLQSTIDANVGWAPRVIVSFDILRDGRVTNIQITKSSNNYSVDTSAVRAIQQSSPLDRLPGGYSGSSVGVEFWFDYKRQ
jgi:periplasmic protein TonB